MFCCRWCISADWRWVQTARGRSRREDVRLAAAQVSRLAAENLPPGALCSSAALRAHFLVFMDDTRGLLASGAHGAPLAAERKVLPYHQVFDRTE